MTAKIAVLKNFVFVSLFFSLIFSPAFLYAESDNPRVQHLAKNYSLEKEMNQYDPSFSSATNDCTSPNCPLVWTETSSAQSYDDSYDLVKSNAVEETLNQIEEGFAPSQIEASVPLEEYTVERPLNQDNELVDMEPPPVPQQTQEGYWASLDQPSMNSADLYPKGYYFDELQKSAQEFKEPRQQRDWQVDLALGAGYRRDDLLWNKADIDGAPNILSELTWDDVESYVLRADGKVTFANRFRLESSLSHGEIFGGDNQDSDYLGNDRTYEFSRSNNKTEDNHVFDISAGLGYQMGFVGDPDFFILDSACVTWLGGYSYHRQDFRIKDLSQTIPATGGMDGLNSQYDSRWKGPWLGFEFSGQKKKWNALFRFEYHWADYYADANWNLRSDLQHPKSFENEADAYGLVYRLGFGYAFNPRWSLNLNADIQNWRAKNGTDRMFFATGDVYEMTLNEVKWDSTALMLEAKYTFGQ